MKAARRGASGKASARRAALFVVTLLTIVGALIGPSPLPVVVGGACLVFAMQLIWRSAEPPVLLLPILYQWSVVAVKPILSAVKDQPLNSLSDFGGDIEQAAYFGFAAIAILALGLRLGSQERGRNGALLLRTEAKAWPTRSAMLVSLALIALGHLMTAASIYAGPARQPMLALGGLTVVGLFALTYSCLVNRKGYGVLALAMGFEIVIGMTGFFAGFRAPLLVFFVAVIAARPTVKVTDLTFVFLAAALLLGAAVFWSSVKNDYRDFVNEGTGAQVVSVSMGARIDHLAEAASNFNRQKFADGFDRLLSRHSYIDFLASTLRYVPSHVPHENGKRLGQSLLHIVTPRIFFPNKPPLPFDSDVTAHYTGLPTNNNPNSSISIGYLGELYIDFGMPGALIATLALGWVAGRGYRAIAPVAGRSALFVYGLCVNYAVQLSTFESALIKIIGASVMTFIVAMLIKRFVLPTLLTTLAPKAMRRKRRTQAPASPNQAV